MNRAGLEMLGQAGALEALKGLLDSEQYQAKP